MLKFNKSVYISDCEFLNILCNGESEDSSFIYFQSNIYGNSINIENSVISNGRSNGDFISINGDLSFINFSNVTINEIYSYGSLLNNISNNVCIYKNFIILNRVNFFFFYYHK